MALCRFEGGYLARFSTLQAAAVMGSGGGNDGAAVMAVAKLVAAATVAEAEHLNSRCRLSFVKNSAEAQKITKKNAQGRRRELPPRATAYRL